MILEGHKEWQDTAFKELQELYQICLARVLVDKNLDRDTVGHLLEYMQQLDWKGKTLYAREFLKIVKTVKPEHEVINQTTEAFYRILDEAMHWEGE